MYGARVAVVRNTIPKIVGVGVGTSVPSLLLYRCAPTQPLLPG